MNKQLLSIISCLVVVLVVASGCGSSGDGGTTSSSLSKAEFIKKGDKLCTRVENERGKAISAFYDQEEASSVQELGVKGQEKMILNVALPPVKKLGGELEALGVPEGDEEEVEAIFDALDESVAQVEQSPVSVVSASESPFQEPKELAGKYGFKVCLQQY
jgi:hypothetical protein